MLASQWKFNSRNHCRGYGRGYSLFSARDITPAQALRSNEGAGLNKFLLLMQIAKQNLYCPKKHKGNNTHKTYAARKKVCAHPTPSLQSIMRNHDMGPHAQTCATRMCNHCATLHLCTTLYAGALCTQIMSMVAELPLELSESTESG